MKIILASRSKFRRQALDLLDVDYEVIPSELNEGSIRDSNPRVLAKKLAEAKAREVGGRLDGEAIIIAGDLFVLFQDKIYEKPESEREAKEMLGSFSGRAVEIISGVSLLNSKTGELNSALGEAKILFRDISKSEINRYVSSYPVHELAGGFEKEGILKFSKEVHGDLSYLTGLPLNRLIQLLQEHGLDP